MNRSMSGVIFEEVWEDRFGKTDLGRRILPMKTEPLENRLRNYLLGELPEAEQTALERELLADREKFDEAWAIENSLIDRYVRGELPPTDRERFERHYLASELHRERVSIAQLFLGDIDKTPERPSAKVESGAGADPWWRRLSGSLRSLQPVFSAAMAIALLFVTGGAIWLLRERSRLSDQLAQMQDRSQAEMVSIEQRKQDLELQTQGLAGEIARERERGRQLGAELERLTQNRQSASPAFLSFLLTPAPTRDKNGPPPPVIPLVKSGMQLLMALDAGDFPGYQIKLQTVEGREILSKPANRTKDRAFAAVTLPAGTLVKGDYILILSGRIAGGELEEVDRYFFRVQ